MEQEQVGQRVAAEQGEAIPGWMPPATASPQPTPQTQEELGQRAALEQRRLAAEKGEREAGERYRQEMEKQAQEELERYREKMLEDVLKELGKEKEWWTEQDIQDLVPAQQRAVQRGPWTWTPGSPKIASVPPSGIPGQERWRLPEGAARIGPGTFRGKTPEQRQTRIEKEVFKQLKVEAEKERRRSQLAYARTQISNFNQYIQEVSSNITQHNKLIIAGFGRTRTDIAQKSVDDLVAAIKDSTEKYKKIVQNVQKLMGQFNILVYDFYIKQLIANVQNYVVMENYGQGLTYYRSDNFADVERYYTNRRVLEALILPEAKFPPEQDILKLPWKEEKTTSEQEWKMRHEKPAIINIGKNHRSETVIKICSDALQKLQQRIGALVQEIGALEQEITVPSQ